MPLMLEVSVFLQEFVNRHEAASNLDLKSILDSFNHDTAAAKLVYALCVLISHKHDFKLLHFWKVVDIICKFSINWITFYWDIDIVLAI